MQRQRRYETLSLGILMFITAVALAMQSAGVITRLDEAFALIIAVYGIWHMVLAGVRAKNPEKYGRDPFSTLVMGAVLIALGGAWYLYIATANFIMSLVLLLVVVGILAVASALPSLRKK